MTFGTLVPLHRDLLYLNILFPCTFASNHKVSNRPRLVSTLNAASSWCICSAGYFPFFPLCILFLTYMLQSPAFYNCCLLPNHTPRAWDPGPFRVLSFLSLELLRESGKTASHIFLFLPKSNSESLSTRAVLDLALAIQGSALVFLRLIVV